MLIFLLLAVACSVALADRLYACNCNSFETLTSAHATNKFILAKGASMDAGVAWFCAKWELDSAKCIALHAEMHDRARPECCNTPAQIPAAETTKAFVSWIWAHGFLQKALSISRNTSGLYGLFMAGEEPTLRQELLFTAPCWSEQLALRSPVFGSFLHTLQSPASFHKVKGALLVVTHIMCEYLLAELEQPSAGENMYVYTEEEYARVYHTESYFTRLFMRDFPKAPAHMYALSYAESEAFHKAAPAFWQRQMKEAADAYVIFTSIYYGKFERTLWERPISPFERIFMSRGHAPPAVEQAWGAFVWALCIMRSRMWRDRLVPIGTYLNHENTASQHHVVYPLDEQVGVVVVTAGSNIAAGAEVFDNYDLGAIGGTSSSASIGASTSEMHCNADLFMKYGFVQDVHARHCLLARVVVGAGSSATATATAAAEVIHVELRYHSPLNGKGDIVSLQTHMESAFATIYDAFKRYLPNVVEVEMDPPQPCEISARSVYREICVNWLVYEAVLSAIVTQDTAIPLDAFDILSKPMLRPYSHAPTSAAPNAGDTVETNSGTNTRTETETETSDRRTWKSRPDVMENIAIIAKGSELVKQQVAEYIRAKQGEWQRKKSNASGRKEIGVQEQVEECVSEYLSLHKEKKKHRHNPDQDLR